MDKKALSREPRSDQGSERMNAAERVSEACSAEQVNESVVQANEQANK